MTPYATYATNRPSYGAGKTRAEQEREALRQQKEDCEAHVRRAKAVTAVADHIVANNMKLAKERFKLTNPSLKKIKAYKTMGGV